MANLKKILLVDDDEDLREALAEQLVSTEDFDVFEAGTGAEGVEKAREGIYDLVILDVGLPDTDGRELCRKLRKQGMKCPILMLTGHDGDADTILGLDAGANDYVTKPFKLDEVKEILNTLRVTMSLSFGMLMIVVSGIINRFDQNRVDMVFWLGFLFAVFLLVIIFLLIIKISQKTKEIKEM